MGNYNCVTLDELEMEDFESSTQDFDVINTPDDSIIVLAKSLLKLEENDENCKKRMKVILKNWQAIVSNNVKRESRYHVGNKEDLRKLIRYAVSVDPNADLNWIDVSKIKDMSFLFWKSPFNGDISEWDVSNVEDMLEMFYSSEFNSDISNWNVAKVESMRWMFLKSKFTGNISNWAISSATKTDGMFLDCQIKDTNKPKSL